MIAGAYPASLDDQETERILTLLLVRHVVGLYAWAKGLLSSMGVVAWLQGIDSWLQC